MKEWECYATIMNKQSESWFAYCDKYDIPYERYIASSPPSSYKIKRWLLNTTKQVITYYWNIIKGGIMNDNKTNEKERYQR
tara:strand:+ start:2038 stop:2280 length:243 start_codon:yes stop_codon:yes gene_type:complete